MREHTTAPIYIGLIGLATVIFAADLFTTLGIAVWIFYVLPVGLTLVGRDSTLPLITALASSILIVVTMLTDPPGITPWIAYLNRVFGLVVIWSMAFLARNLINTRNRVEVEESLRRTQTRLLEAMQGELSLSEIGTRALDVIAGAIGAPVSALYARTGSQLRLAASQGLRAGAELPEVLDLNDGVIGQAARSGRVSVLNELPDSFFTIRSALVSGAPRHVIVTPLVADGTTQGVLEVGTLQAPDRQALDLLDRAKDGVAIAIRTAFYRDRLRGLLEETQRQSEELQAQQEELRVANEELEQQRDVLKASQVRLEEQQAELEATNAQLEGQAQDLVEQKYALSAAKQEAERASRYKSEFLANMSHELRTPLNSTLILAKLLSENKTGRLTDEQVRYAETIYSSGNSLLTLINDILDLSKIESGAVEVRPEETALTAVIDGLFRTFQPIANDKRLEFTRDIQPGTPATVITDGQRLHQVLTNLLSNAFKFTESGAVGLRVSPAGSDAIAFEVRDSGVGIPREQQDTIFEAFRQADGSTHRKYGGTGLGLSISRELAHLLGGEIRVHSDLGAGSTFTLTIPTRLTVTLKPVPAAIESGRSAVAQPVAAAPVRTKSRPPEPAPVEDDRGQRQRPGRLILVIEDDPSFARILYSLAHELDFDCVIAHTNDEGMALARDLSPSGILLDVNLPDGSGLTLLDRLKRNPDTRHIPVHMVSVSDRAQTALGLGAVGFALKPVQRDELVKVIRKLEDRLEHRVRRVLVVEDDDRLRSSIKELLQLDGVTIHDVGTARDALAQLAAESFDCVVLDLNLPDASGYEILETMSANEQVLVSACDHLYRWADLAGRRGTVEAVFAIGDREGRALAGAAAGRGHAVSPPSRIAASA